MTIAGASSDDDDYVGQHIGQTCMILRSIPMILIPITEGEES